MKKRYFITITILFAVGCAFLFNVFYAELKKTALRNLNVVQLIQAKQLGIAFQAFFTTWTKSLTALSKEDEIINNNPLGKNYLRLFYEAHQDQIIKIARLNEKGILIYDYPLSKQTGTDISNYEHVRFMLQNHRPMVSDVFTTLEGVRTIAVHVPVFQGTTFKGSVSILINFENLTKHYCEDIKIGKTRMAWVISRDGTLLYSPVPGFSGKPAIEIVKRFPTVAPMVKDMLLGKQGISEYIFNQFGNPKAGVIKKYALYMPVQIENTFWSICVTTTESDVLSSLIRFRNKLLLLIGILFIFGMVFSIYGMKAWLIFKDREQRKKMDDDLRKSEFRFRSIIDNLQDAYFEIDKYGIISFASHSGSKMYGYKSPKEMMGLSSLGFYAHQQDRKLLLKEMDFKGSVLDYVCKGRRKDGSTFWSSMNAQYQYDGNKEISGIIGVVRDVSERKHAEAKLLESEAKYRDIYDNALEGMYRTSLEGKNLQANNAMAIMLGYKSAEKFMSQVMETGLQLWVAQEDRVKFTSLFENKDVVLGYECLFKRLDGRLIWVSLSTRLIRDKKGRVLYYEGFIEDITTRRENEQIISNKMKDLQWHYDIAIERELKMVDLKKEINKLLTELSREKRYLM